MSTASSIDPLVLGIGAVFLLIALAFALAFATLIARDRSISDGENWDEICSPTRYQAMQRILEEGDPQLFFRDARMEKQKRAERVQVLRGYLRRMSSDFNRISGAIKLLMIQSQTDRPDLARILISQKFQFTVALISMEWKLSLYGLGLSGVDARQFASLSGTLQALRSELQFLATAAAPSAA